jgi:hypothetical protein
MTSKGFALMEKLTGPWTAAHITPKQEQHRKDIELAKKLWDSVLEEYREKRTAYFAERAAREKGEEEDTDGDGKKSKDGDKNEKAGERATDQPVFPFLELSGELRNMIYEISIEDDRVERRRREGDGFQRRYTLITRGMWNSGRYGVYRQYARRAGSYRDKGPTSEQRERENQRRRLLNDIIHKRLQQGKADSAFTTAARKAFKKYTLEHNMYTKRCWHEEHAKENVFHEKIANDGTEKGRRSVAVVNARGNLCDDLPMLSMVNREIFHDTFGLYYSIAREGMWFKWHVRNLDFFPLLRFCQRLGRPWCGVEIDPSRIHIEFDRKNYFRDRELHFNQFSNLKRLIELHWLEGFPLWSCLTGVRPGEESCETPLGDWLYSIRQVVALYRAERGMWKELTIAFLQRTITVNARKGTGKDWEALNDAQLVEEAIEVLCRAIEYQLGYEGNFSVVGRNGSRFEEDVYKTFRYNPKHKKIASKFKHAVVDIAEQFRKEVSIAVKDMLGEAYEDWEEFVDKQKIPQDIVL